ncbi:hypothetical protein KJ608_01685 [Patescibacteria group bacterium]|nr:hypothetical protein [Patescibacteria group bacterium]
MVSTKTQGDIRKRTWVNEVGRTIVSTIFHTAALAVVGYFWWPIINAYLQADPARGIDIYLTVSNVTHLVKRFSDPVTSWWYQWYGGRPFEAVYPVLHFYLILPLTRFFSVFRAVQIYVSGALTLFVAFCYLLFYRISRNYLVSIIVTLLTIFSYGQYLGLFWAGSIPYTATMFFLPLALLFVINFLEKQDMKYLYLAGLATGLGMLGHPQVMVAWAIPLVSLMIVLGTYFEEEQWVSRTRTRIRSLIIYYSIVTLVGFRQLAFVGLEGIFTLLSGIFRGKLVGIAAEVSVHPEEAIAQTMLAQRTFLVKILEVFDEVPQWVSSPFPILLALAFALFLGLFLIHRNKRKFLGDLLLTGGLLGYGFLFAYLFFMGLNPFAGGWIRVYWGFTVLMGVVICWLMRESLRSLGDFFSKKLGLWNISALSLNVLLSGAVCLTGLLLVIPVMEGFTSHILTRAHPFPDKPEILHEHTQESSAYPSLLSLDKDKWGGDVFKSLTPVWLDPNRLDYRLYDLDATVNIWWSSWFDMPLVRGYLDSPGGENYSGWQYWMNVVLAKDEIVERLEMPLELAKNQAKFFIDWHAIGYLEGKGGAIGRDFGVPFSSYLIDEEMISKSEEVNIWRPLRDWYIDLPGFWETLEYHQINPARTSPIYQATNAPAVLVIGDAEAHNVLMRIFGSLNLNSQKAILVQGSPRVGDYSLEELNNFRMVILYRYTKRTQGKDWEMLEKYVGNGGVLFIDTGDEGPEAEAEQLPALFPISANTREPLGKEWALKGDQALENWGVDITKFTAPIFDDEPWSFSYAEEEAVDKGTRVILENHGRIIMADTSLGNGSVIWSGMNFPYHILREHNTEELRLFEKLLERAVSTEEPQGFLTGTEFKRVTPEKVVIKSKDAAAVLFKEAGYEGWRASIKAGGEERRLKIYQAGPMQPGYMYVRVPSEFRDRDSEVTFIFTGVWRTWLYYAINFLGVLFVIDLITGKHGIALLTKFTLPLRRKVGEWWGKDEEY